MLCVVNGALIVRMSDSLERTTDTPLSGPSEKTPREGSDPEEEGEGGDGSGMRWEDGGLSVELQRGMETLRVSGELTDVTLRVQEQDFPCHRAVLAAASHYYRYMHTHSLP